MNFLSQTMSSESTRDETADSVAVDLAKDVVENMRSSDRTCGISSVLNQDGDQLNDHSEQCGMVMTTNCSVTYKELTCPSACPFLAPSRHFPCNLKCVKREACSAANAGRPFPNVHNMMCEACAVEACKVCSSRTQCEICHDSFEMQGSPDTCTFALDKNNKFRTMVVNMVEAYVLPVLIVLVVVAVLAVAIYILFGSTTSAHRDANLKQIVLGRRQRHLKKVHEWDLSSSKKPCQLVSLFADLHNQNILGVGFALYYNSICFIMAVSLITCAFTCVMYLSSSDISEAMPVFMHDPTWLLDSGMALNDAEPAIIVSRLRSCGQHSASDVSRALEKFATTAFVGTSILYVFLFLYSLRHARNQRKATEKFDKNSSSMSDYVLEVENLPPDVIDEADLKDWFSNELRHKVGAEIDVHGVSIAYDFKDRVKDVEAMLMRFQEGVATDLEPRALVPVASDLGSLRSLLLVEDPERPLMRKAGSKVFEDGSDWSKIALDEEVERQHDRLKVLDWFDSSTPIRSTGRAFIVFSFSKHARVVFDAFNNKDLELLHPKMQDKPVIFHRVFSEPPEIMWVNMAVTSRDMSLNLMWAAAKLIAFFAACQVFVVYPLSLYVVIPFAKASAAQGSATAVAGILMGAVNAMLGAMASNSANGIGFRRRDRMDGWFFFTSVILTLANTVLNIFTIAFQDRVHNSSSADFYMFDLNILHSTLRTGAETRTVRTVFQMLVPGQFFVGKIVEVFTSHVLSYIVTTLLLQLIYVWRPPLGFVMVVLKWLLPNAPSSTDKLDAGAAENCFRSTTIGLPNDYGTILVNSCMAFFLLAYMSPYVYYTMLAMFGWSVFFYCLCRYRHLRVESACSNSTHRLDTFYNILWGLPLSLVANAAVVWGMRSGHIMPHSNHMDKFIVQSAAVTFSLVAWMLIYYFGVQPMSRSTVTERTNESVDKVEEELLYSWYNCNPVFSLKSAYFLKDKEGHSSYKLRKHPIAHGLDPDQARHFEVGKEFLFFPTEMQDSFDKVASMSEFETVLEWLLGMMASRTEIRDKFTGHAWVAQQFGQGQIASILGQ